ncbi:EmrB/QacA subfamily drug resistance transporter [Methanomicrobium sp. W14]|uniref:MFS transporter n=1 Tax=Methanomicrobium sp. W14 TaxID=2817839 RepID=UPI001AE22228|nr:MFS transporter [Methanomicrobium sp. W14]MBP2132501.1 EmrB/QacA subfamily drug resistance transporter [Methanomicrobium sp. W14]
MNKSDTDISGKYSPDKRKAVMFVALLGMYMSVLDGVVISIALPTITSYFNADLALSQWTITGYLVAMTAAMLVFARMSESVGKNRMFLSGMAVFTAGSLGCALAPTLSVLICLRIIQGLGAAMSVSIVMAIIFELYPFSEHGKAMGLLGSTIAVASLSGPVLGGFLLSFFSWHAIFMINVPVGIALVAFGAYSMDLKKPEKSEKVRTDWPGAASLGAAIVSSMLFLGYIADGGKEVYATVALCACVLSLVAFVTTERRRISPLIDLSIFSERMFTVPLVCMALMFTAYMILSIAMPFYLEGVMNFSPLQVGMVFIGIAVILTFGAPVTGRIYDRHPRKYFTGAGLFAGALGLLAFACSLKTYDLTLILGALVVFAVGFTLFQGPVNAEIMHGLPKEKSAVASGMNSAARQFAMALGSSLASIIFAFQLRQEGYTGVVTKAGAALVTDAASAATAFAALLCFIGVALLALKKNAKATGCAEKMVKTRDFQKNQT